MNHDKARELFSAYYEETLESGLRQQLETRFRADANLKADYAAFVETIEALDGLRFEEIDVPLSLNDRIATRMEQEEAKRRRPVLVWGNWLRGLGFSGLAAAAVLAAFVAIRPGNGPATASLVPSQGSVAAALPANRLVFSAKNRDVLVSYRAEESGSVVVSAAGSGREIQRFPVGTDELHTPLQNSHPTPALLRVTASGDASGAVVVLPGTQKQSAKSGSGTLLDLASAVASHYGVPVVVRGNSMQNVVWNFEDGSARHATEAALAGTKASADQRDGDLITILGN
jgi:hypothetical protein